MVIITPEAYICDDFEVQFYGWTNYNNSQYSDFDDLIEFGCDFSFHNFPNVKVSVKPEKEVLIDRINECRAAAENCLIAHIKDKNIKFDGTYHQNGSFGTPLFLIKKCTGAKDLQGKIIKWTATFRYWGGIMEAADFGKIYLDWAWSNAENPVYPNTVIGENCV